MGRLSDAMRRAAEREDPSRAPGPALATELAEVPAPASAAPDAIDEMFPAERAPRPAWPVDAGEEWAFDEPEPEVRHRDVGDHVDAAVGNPAVDDQFGFEAAAEQEPGDQAPVPEHSLAEDFSLEDEPATVVPPAALGATTPEPSLFERVDLRYSGKVVVDANIAPVSKEQYRRLAAALHHAQEATGVKVVMIASAVASEGKTLTASNLALTLSESYKRHVLLVDGDLRKPSLHTMFRVTGTPGLSEGLTAASETKLPLRQVSATLTVLTAGASTLDPMSGLTSGRMRRMIDEARAAFDWVIIDTPPVGLLTDASLLGAMVDGAVLVVRANVTPFDLVQRAVEALGKERVLGVVLNQATTATPGQDYAHYYRTTPAVEAPESA